LCQACPRCFVIIRKETGCNHVQCRCGASFCYGCGAPCDSHGCLCGKASEKSMPRLARWLKASDHPVCKDRGDS
jgi:hypothetical protein